MRLLTRSDFDGLSCAVLLKEVGLIDGFKFVHPKDLQDGLVEVSKDDVLANVPYVEGCGMWFDHHISEKSRLGKLDVPGSVQYVDSACRVIYDYYKDEHDLSRFAEMVDMVDKVDSAKLTKEDIVNPKGWVMLGFLMDPRTGLGRFREFRISNYQLMEQLIDMCRVKNIDEILASPDVKERIEMYNEQNELFVKMVEEHTTTTGNVIVTDLRGVSPIYTGNRFLLYTMYPDQNISLWVVDGRAGLNVAIAAGYSILNHTATINVGETLLQYGGGGHKQVGTCQIDIDKADEVIAELVEMMR